MQAQRNGTLKPGSTESAIRQWQMSSFEVEQVLLSHAAVANAAAVPVRSSLAEDEVMAAVILHPGRQLTEAELIAFLRTPPALFRGPAVSRIHERAAEHRERHGAKVQGARAWCQCILPEAPRPSAAAGNARREASGYVSGVNEGP